jgi:hypothetical protein
MRSSSWLILLLGGCSYNRGPLGLWMITEYAVTSGEQRALVKGAGTWEYQGEPVMESAPGGLTEAPNPLTSSHLAVILAFSYEPLTGAMLPVRAPQPQVQHASYQEEEDWGLESITGYSSESGVRFDRFQCAQLTIVETEETSARIDEPACVLAAFPPGAPDLAAASYRIELTLAPP